jgi:hypothetical protein
MSDMVDTFEKAMLELESVLTFDYDNIPDVRGITYFDNWDLTNKDEFTAERLEKLFHGLLICIMKHENRPFKKQRTHDTRDGITITGACSNYGQIRDLFTPFPTNTSHTNIIGGCDVRFTFKRDKGQNILRNNLNTWHSSECQCKAFKDRNEWENKIMNYYSNFNEKVVLL